MDILAWLWWLLSSLLGLVWTVVWFLLGGWVSTLAQIGVIVLVIFGMKYGWRQAPQEAASRLGSFGRFAWAWVRSGEAPPSRTLQQDTARGAARRRRREPGDVRINVSTTLSLMAMGGLGLFALLL